MSDRPRSSGPQFRADRPEQAGEPEAVRTTIVGGRPPGGGRSLGNIPRGIEVLVNKAAVDPVFRRELLDRREQAAAQIGLQLDPAEAMMLAAAPAAQLEAVIERTRVPDEHRRAFLGKAAAAMLAALGAASTDALAGFGTTGTAPDMPPPAPAPAQRLSATVRSRVIQVVAREMGERPDDVDETTRLDAHLRDDAKAAERLAGLLSRELKLMVLPEAVRRMSSVGDLIEYLDVLRRVEPKVVAVIRKELGRTEPGTFFADTPLASPAGPGPMELGQLVRLREGLVRALRVYVSWDELHEARTVGQVVDCATRAVHKVEQRREPQVHPVEGIRPDVPAAVKGIRPDVPPTRGIQPDVPPAPTGIRPDVPPSVGGIRPGGGASFGNRPS